MTRTLGLVVHEHEATRPGGRGRGPTEERTRDGLLDPIADAQLALLAPREGLLVHDADARAIVGETQRLARGVLDRDVVEVDSVELEADGACVVGAQPAGDRALDGAGIQLDTQSDVEMDGLEAKLGRVVGPRVGSAEGAAARGVEEIFRGRHGQRAYGRGGRSSCGKAPSSESIEAHTPSASQCDPSGLHGGSGRR